MVQGTCARKLAFSLRNFYTKAELGTASLQSSSVKLTEVGKGNRIMPVK